MARHTPEQEIQQLLDIIAKHPDGVSAAQIAEELENRTPHRTLQHRLGRLVDAGRIVQEGEARSTRYRPAETAGATAAEVDAAHAIPLSQAGKEIQAYLRLPYTRRAPAGYDRSFLDGYRPNETTYLSEEDRGKLHELGKAQEGVQPAGTHAKQILDRLLIDLSWNSSRLEGNTYSLLDTRRLIEFGQVSEGKDQVDAQMILNHKDAIEFLVSEADEIGFNRYTLLNLHAMLANNLLPDPVAPGRLRKIAVGVEQSAFHPLEVPQLIEECFDQLLATVDAIKDPFEQAFFVMVQLPYLQPFDDVNKRVSRLAANIPLVKANLAPLSFADVSQDIYTQAVLGVYERQRIELLRDVFRWAYERSAARYSAVRQSLGEPDPFRVRYRDELREAVAHVVLNAMNRQDAVRYLEEWTEQNIESHDRFRFRETAEDELLSLHEGNFARYRIRPSAFRKWQETWRR